MKKKRKKNFFKKYWSVGLIIVVILFVLEVYGDSIFKQEQYQSNSFIKCPVDGEITSKYWCSGNAETCSPRPTIGVDTNDDGILESYEYAFPTCLDGCGYNFNNLLDFKTPEGYNIYTCDKRTLVGIEYSDGYVIAFRLGGTCVSETPESLDLIPTSYLCPALRGINYLAITSCDSAFDAFKTTYGYTSFSLVGTKTISTFSNYTITDYSKNLIILNKIYLGDKSEKKYTLELYSFDKQKWIELNSVGIDMGQLNNGEGKEFNVRGQVDFDDEYLSKNNEILIKHKFYLQGTLQYQGVEIRDYYQNVSFLSSKIISSCGDGICDGWESCSYDCEATSSEYLTHHERKCYDDDVYWYNSNGNREDKYKDCENGCLKGQCLGESHICGDGACQMSESLHTCPEDCSEGFYCGNNICEEGETKINCQEDCKELPSPDIPKPSSFSAFINKLVEWFKIIYNWII